MRRNTTIYLIPKTPGENDIGDSLHNEGKPRRLLAEKKSIRQSEFYQAAATGLKPELTFVVWPHEYRGEDILKFNEKSYKIIRTFEKNHKELELICEGMSING